MDEGVSSRGIDSGTVFSVHGKAGGPEGCKYCFYDGKMPGIGLSGSC